MASIGTRIMELRRKRSITQDQLAETMGVSSQAVSKWENDISCPDITLLPKLADYFSVSIDTLLRGEGNDTVQMVPKNERKDFNRLILKIIVNSAKGDIVNINLPLSLVKAGLEIGMQMPQINANGKLNESIKDIDFNAIIQLAESGMIGKFIDIKSADNDTVEIFIE